MRYLVGFVFALALGASPSSVSPQASALQLQLDDDSVKIAPRAYRVPTAEEMEMKRRVMRAKVGLGVSVPFMVVGTILTASGASGLCFAVEFGEPCDPIIGLTAAGAVIAVGALGGTVASGILLRRRKRDLRRLQLVHDGIPDRTRRGYTLEEAELRMKRARIGLGVAASTTVLGVGLVTAGTVGDCHGATYSTTSRCDPLITAGAVIIGAGVAGMIATGVLSVKRTRDRDWLSPPDYGRSRRAQWDFVTSRLVF